ncbi:MAG TPA: ABC transporter ATP-binding protein, partial [Chloroflexota bacterium]|nr:ABC transporter ATP-binding protein [Chloroflexota bacterium]
IDLEVTRGDFVVITGRSGSGKTTLLNLAAGLTRPSSGEVLVGGVNLWTLPDREQSLLRNQRIGFAFQFPSLLPSLTVQENVALPTMFGPKEGRVGAHERAAKLLGEVGLSDKLNAYPRQLSAGQYKRTVIARSLINGPEMLFADEPTGDLDEQTEREFMSFLREIYKAAGLTVLLVTHNRDLILYGTRAVEMANGEIVS